LDFEARKIALGHGFSRAPTGLWEGTPLGVPKTAPFRQRRL
jgi:hypothetical protein